MPDVLYEDVIEVEERVILQKENCLLPKKHPVEVASTGERVRLVNVYVCSRVSYITKIFSSIYIQNILHF